jgi:serine/threonine protein kinase
VSKEGNDLLQKLLKQKPEERISAREALYHPWIQKASKNVFSKEISSEVLSNLNTFHVKRTNN